MIDVESNTLPELTIVCGRPGAGKTTLARVISRELRCPMISRDEIYHGIKRTLPLASQEILRERAFLVFFQTVEFFLSKSTSLVIEAAFRNHVWLSKLEPILSVANVKVIQCVLDAGLAHDRVLRRRQEEIEIGNDIVGKPPSSIVHDFEYLSLSVPTLRVSTIEGYNPSIDEITAFAET